MITEALQNLKEMGLLTVAVLEALPIRMDDFPEAGMFYPIVEAVRDALMDKELLPADDGTFVSAQSAKLARSAELRRLLSQDQLRSLFQSNDEIKWLSGEITQDRTPDLRTYLMNELDVEEITPDGFARRISASFLADQTDDWFVSFYMYLSGQEALWRSPRWTGDAGGLLRGKPILRLQDNRQEAPFRSDGTVNAYLPPPEETDFPVVKRQIVSNEQTADFLRRLGLSEPDVFDEIIERVLPKYARQDISSISPYEHTMDIQKILRAMASDSESGKKKLREAAKQTPFLRAVDQNGNISFKKPCEIYYPKRNLQVYFTGSSDVWFLNETESAKEWRTFGVETKPRFKKISIDISPDEKYRLRHGEGITKDIESIGYEIDGLTGFLNGFKEENKDFLKNAIILWKFIKNHLNDHLKKNPYGNFYKGKYKWFYRTEKSNTFDSPWEGQLRSNAWLPKKGDDFSHKPNELGLDDLPESFIRDERLADILGMKKNDVVKLAEKYGVPIEHIEFVKKHPDEFQKWMADITAKKESPAFPTRTMTNPERRQERLLEQLADAPEKEYEQRPRSVRPTRDTIDPPPWLRSQYTNEADQMICQICKKEMPFRKRNGEYYFEAVEALSKDHFSREHEAQFLALCPLCAAMYKEFVKNDETAMKTMRSMLINAHEPEISLCLGVLRASVWFVESHYHDIKTILRAPD